MNLLFDILSTPTAPFREGQVILKIIRTLKLSGVPYFQDPHGNILVGVKSPADYLHLIRKKSKEPLRFFIAHLDHPGFHGSQWKSSRELAIQWHGGSPTQYLEGAKVWLSHSSGFLTHGILKNPELTPSGKSLKSGWVHLEENPKVPATELYGGFCFRAPVWNEGERIYTQAADDLVGAYGILSMAIQHWGSKKRAQEFPWIGLLTRAEEVGFIGALAHFELGWLQKAKRPVLCVSLETSRALPDAEIGKGPVVRLGDRFTPFDPGALRVLSDVAVKTLPNRHQKRMMDGGTCEASAATVFGFKSIGISVPLGNYHNQSLEGGPDSAPPLGPAPEFVHSNDIEGLILLCNALMKPKLNWENPWDEKLKDLKKGLKTYKKLLRSSP
jgi:putative aminopeptidase FrvX